MIEMLILSFSIGGYVVGWVVGRAVLKRKTNRALVDYANRKMTATIDSAFKRTMIDGLFDIDAILAEKKRIIDLIKSITHDPHP